MRYSFEACVLDTDRRELRRGPGLVAVEPQVFDLIQFLIENRERVVSRDELIEGVWQGRIVSESTLATRINAARRAIGDDGTAQRLIKTVARKGVRFAGPVAIPDAAAAREPAPPTAQAQSITFCRTADGVSLAVGTAGKGPVLLKTANWLTHLEYDWQSPLWAPMYARLVGAFRLIRYDGRGNGLSDREAADVSLAGFERDLDAVVATVEADRFAMLGISQGGAAAISYAVRHPERVTRLVLYGAYARGRRKRGSPEEIATADAFTTLMRQGWGDERSAFMRAFSSFFLPNGTPEQVSWFVELQRRTTSADMAARIRRACDDIDVVDLLARVKVPTLVLHARRDNVVPLEEGRMIAAAIPGARFVSLDSENHVLLPGEPAFEALLGETAAFAAGP